jgi:hypothetical protein
MSKITDQEYAEYMLANYIQGYIDTSIFIGANLFEKYFLKEVPAKDIEQEKSKQKKKHLELWAYIDLYFSSKKYKDDVLRLLESDLKDKIKDFKNLRNDFIHQMDDNKIIQRKSEIGEFILYVYFSFHKNEKYDSTIIYDESIKNTLLQDYKIKEITERMIARMEKEKYPFDSYNVKNFKGITIEDFKNLFELRKKLRYLQRNLEKELLNVELEATILSPIDTTSAYIWMPFVNAKFIKSNNKIIKTQRHNLVMGSVSILATPIDFRIYLDFGGGDFEFRTEYQKFLKSNMFKEYIVRFKNIEPSLKIFETRWYSFIVDEKNVFDIIDQDNFKSQIENALIFLENAQAQDSIITSGRNLLGFIVPSSEPLSKEFIIERFKDISHLYYEFLIYRFPESESDLRKIQVKLFNQKNNIFNNEDKEEIFSINSLDKYDYEGGYKGSDEQMNQINFKRDKK